MTTSPESKWTDTSALAKSVLLQREAVIRGDENTARHHEAEAVRLATSSVGLMASDPTTPGGAFGKVPPTLTREDFRKMPAAELDALYDKATTEVWGAAASKLQSVEAFVAAADRRHEIEMAVYLQIGDGARK